MINVQSIEPQLLVFKQYSNYTEDGTYRYTLETAHLWWHISPMFDTAHPQDSTGHPQKREYDYLFWSVNAMIVCAAQQLFH